MKFKMFEKKHLWFLGMFVVFVLISVLFDFSWYSTKSILPSPAIICITKSLFNSPFFPVKTLWKLLFKFWINYVELNNSLLYNF
jgi:hypothetical protein